MAELVPFPPAQDMPRQRDSDEIVAAIVMVSAGVARRVRLVNLAEPFAAAAEGAAQASAAGVAFRVERDGEHVEVVVGPLR